MDMRVREFNRARVMLLVLVAIGTLLSIYFDILMLAVLFVGLGMVVISFLKSQVKETIEDERVRSIHEKAARTSFKILMPILGLTSFALFCTGEGPFTFVRSLGIVLGYITIVGLLVYIVSYYYLNRRYGG